MGACQGHKQEADLDPALARVAELQKPNVFTAELKFPMYVVPLQIFMGMTEVKPFEVLMQEQVLVKYQPHMGDAIFVSHQWAGRNHPDPHFRQLRVLQGALANLTRTSVHILATVLSFVILGERRCFHSSELMASPLFIWYDYFSCPQLEIKPSDQAESDLQKAVDSIPGYVCRAKFFFVLAPVIEHTVDGTLLGKQAWKRRGWCRVERVARECQRDSRIVYIDSPEIQHLMEPFESLLAPVGEGEFSVDSDRERVLNLMKDMLHTQLLALLRTGDLHRYRFLLNRHRKLLEAFCSEVVALSNQSNTPLGGGHGGNGGNGGHGDPVLNRFLRENGFHGPWFREFGWTPVCFAALRGGGDRTLDILLKRQADVNEHITRSDPENHIHKGMSLLHLCAQFGNNEALKLLIDQRANVDAQDDEAGTTPLHRAGIGDNPDGVLLLLRAGCNPYLCEKLAGVNVLFPAWAWGAQRVTQMMLEQIPGLNISCLLHFGILGCSNTRECITSLVAAGADVNEKFRLFPGWLDPVFALLAAFCRRFHGSTLTFIMSNVSGATPLVCSLITSSFEAASALLDAGADVNIRNACGSLPVELAAAVSAPTSLLEKLTENGMNFMSLPAAVRQKLAFSV